jgi:phage tail tape-measure protein
MKHSNEQNNFDGNVEESGNNLAGSDANQDTSDFGESETAGTLTDAIAGAMIGAPFGLVGTVIGGVTGGVIGNQMVETADADNNLASNNRDESNNTNSINE